MGGNQILWDLFKTNWAALILMAVLIVPILPPSAVGGLEKYFNTYSKKDEVNPKVNILQFLTKHMISPVFELVVMLGLRGTVSLILYTVVFTDLYFNKTISNNSVILTIVGLIAMHFEFFAVQGESIKLGGLFSWKAKKDSAAKPSKNSK